MIIFNVVMNDNKSSRCSSCHNNLFFEKVLAVVLLLVLVQVLVVVLVLTLVLLLTVKLLM